MDFDSLPRDLQLRIVSKFDMDARIKCGIIGKLRVPNSLVATLNKVFQKISHKHDGTEINISKHYLIFSSKPLALSVNYWKCFVHIRPNSTIQCYYFSDVHGHWAPL